MCGEKSDMIYFNQFIKYYLSSIQNPEQQQYVTKEVNTFNHNFSQYVNNNLRGKKINLNSFSQYQYDRQNNLLLLNIFNLDAHLSIQPCLHLNQANQIISLSFVINLNNNSSFFYLTPFDYNESFNTFSYVIYMYNYCINNQVIPTFFNMINQINDLIYSQKQEVEQKRVEELPSIEESEESNEKSNEPDSLTLFIEKYGEMITKNTSSEVLKEKEDFRDNLYKNISSYLQQYIIGKTFKYSSFLDTFTKYSPIFDSMHMDKQINLIGHYFDFLSIKPIIEYSFVKNLEENNHEEIITIDFLKLDISYFNPQYIEDKFEVILPIIPFEKDSNFENLLDLIIILQFQELPIYQDKDNPEIKHSSLDLVPFLETLFDELIKTFKLLQHPILKRTAEAQFLKDNMDFNEKELNRYM